MAQKKIAAKTSWINRRLKEGRGQGHGKDYVPWLTVRDVPSHGKSSRIASWTSERPHHLLSQAELYCFYMFDWSSKIKDIREQFPLLPIESTLEIAERLGIKHPADVRTKEPQVMTTDFLLDVDKGELIELAARAVKKSPDDLSSARTIEKLEIERTYWKEKGIDWGIITESDIPLPFAKNVEWIHTALRLEESPSITPTLLISIEGLLYSEIRQPGKPLAQASHLVDEKLGLNPGSCLWAARHLIATRRWVVDMTCRINPSKPLAVTRAIPLQEHESKYA